MKKETWQEEIDRLARKQERDEREYWNDRGVEAGEEWIARLEKKVKTRLGNKVKTRQMEMYHNEGPLYRVELSYLQTPTCYICYKYHDHPIEPKESKLFVWIAWNMWCDNWNGYVNNNNVSNSDIYFDKVVEEDVVETAVRIHNAYREFYDTIVSKVPRGATLSPNPTAGQRKLLI